MVERGPEGGEGDTVGWCERDVSESVWKGLTEVHLWLVDSD